MTDKKKRIVEVALELFALEGFDKVPTSRIAKQAGVSEGLIFRHFKNKEGLLAEIVEDIKEKIQAVFAPIMSEQDPRKVIIQSFLLPLSIEESEYNYWRLQYKLKWETSYPETDKLAPVEHKLTEAFSELGVKQPQVQAKALLIMVDGMAMKILNEGREGMEEVAKIWIDKFTQ